VNGNVLALAGAVVAVGAVLLVAVGSTVLDGVVDGALVDFDGDVPLFGEGVVGVLAFELP
jgi:hypothetical protein